MNTTVYFNTINNFKWEECELIARALPGVEVRRTSELVTEVNSINIEFVSRRKVLEAYQKIQVPLFVEHGGLYIDWFRGLPGPLSQPF